VKLPGCKGLFGGEYIAQPAPPTAGKIDGSGQGNRFGRLLLASGIVFGAKSWIGQHLIGLLQQNELFNIAGLRVVRVKAGRQKSINAVNCFALGIGADLKELVVIWKIQMVSKEEQSLS